MSRLLRSEAIELLSLGMPASKVARELGLNPDTIAAAARRGDEELAWWVSASSAARREVREHGSASGVKRHCRCNECRRYRREQNVKARARRAEREPGVRHGTEGGYTNWSCRCDACCDANRASLRRRAVNGGHGRRGYPWTGPELEMVLQIGTTRTAKQVAEALGRSVNAVYTARQRALHDPKWVALVNAPSESG